MKMRIEKPVQAQGGTHRISYAQNMEDILLDRLFAGRVGSFVDVGANHPFIDSNTYFFYVRGWRGVNLEPLPRGHALFQEFRPEDRNLAIAASDSDEEGVLSFYEVIGPDGMTGLSTLSAEIAEQHRSEGFEVVEQRVPVRTMASLVAEYRIEPPDFASIDVEGHEGAVIRGLPLDRWRPKVLVVEATLPLSHTASHTSWEPILIEKGYLFATFNGVNRFYVRDDLRDQIELLQTPVNVFDQYQRHETIFYWHGYEKLKSDLEHERFCFEQERGGWAWGAAQARHAQTLFEQERAAFARERAAWKDAQVFFEQAEKSWEWERKRYEYERGAWEQARAMYERERSEYTQARAQHERERATFEAERTQRALERAAWEHERAELARLLAEARTELRAYRAIDRLGVVTKGFSLARRVKRRLVS
jgi:FkbM family methyltransferase